MISVHRFSDHRSEPMERQPENFFALEFGPAPTLGVVVKDGAGSAAFEAAPLTMIKFLGGDFDRQCKIRRRRQGGLETVRQGGFQVPDAFRLRSIVAWIMRWLVEWQHPEAGQHFSHRVMIKGRCPAPD